MLLKYRNVLVPLDFTEKNLEALNVAQQLARQNDAHVTLLHVIETIEYVADDDIETFYNMLRDRAKRKLDLAAGPFEESDIEVDRKIVLGKRGRGIVTYAIQNDIELVVMSSHKVSLSDPPRGLGSLSHQVSMMCPCAVLLVK